MEFLLFGISLLLLLPAGIVLVNMLAGPFLRVRWLRASAGSDMEDVSMNKEDAAPEIAVLVPARNEEANIGHLLSALSRQNYPCFSVTVLDDQSTDGTADIVRRHAEVDPRIRLLQGAALPDGWTGKNWACHQLARQSEAECMLFVDADVLPEATAISDTVSRMQQYHADALSAFPRQKLSGAAATIIVPIMDLLLYAFLPLQLVWRSSKTSLAAANGQWFAFRRSAYRRVGGHESVRTDIVEDIALARRVKSAGLRMLLTAGNGSVSCRMYDGWPAVREGFAKNFFAAFQFRFTVFPFVLLLLLLLFVIPYVMLLTPLRDAALPAVLLNLIIRIPLVFGAGHRWLSALLHPLGILLAVGIGIDAMQRYLRGAVRWKDRDIPVGAGT
ncbi:glycosyltransferase family 2 protein [bacterium]|nr:glycosyltransferase family 2 protein [bacterium]